jgi:hypothetical protein
MGERKKRDNVKEGMGKGRREG